METLSQKMIDASKRVHSLSNTVVLVKAAAVFTSRELYGGSLGAFSHVFRELEAQLDQARAQAPAGACVLRACRAHGNKR